MTGNNYQSIVRKRGTETRFSLPLRRPYRDLVGYGLKRDKTYSTPELDALIVAMCDAGIPDSVIAETLGVRYTLVYARRRFVCDSVVPQGRPPRGARARWLKQAEAIAHGGPR